MVSDCVQAARNFFSEIISSISDVRFSHDGRYMLSRDFMTLKLWDINMESTPVATYPVHESLRSRVGICMLHMLAMISVAYVAAQSWRYPTANILS